MQHGAPGTQHTAPSTQQLAGWQHAPPRAQQSGADALAAAGALTSMPSNANPRTEIESANARTDMGILLSRRKYSLPESPSARRGRLKQIDYLTKSGNQIVFGGWQQRLIAAGSELLAGNQHDCRYMAGCEVQRLRERQRRHGPTAAAILGRTGTGIIVRCSSPGMHQCQYAVSASLRSMATSRTPSFPLSLTAPLRAAA